MILEKQPKPKSSLSFLSDEFIESIEEYEYIIEESFKPSEDSDVKNEKE